MDQIPTIHNYYSDLFLSLANYFDKILGNDKIQHYEFNIGNKAFQLNYKTQKGLPSCIINYNTSRMEQYYDWFLHRPDMGNHFLIPIVYDATKNLSLYIQEAQYEHSISVIFNCNSVFEMLELQHRFDPYLPLNKYIEVFNYYTFFEIPQYFLNPLMFDTNRDTIYNLYTKRDSLTNELVEMASVKYDPLIRVDNFQSAGIDTDNKTFTLNMELSILNPVPLYFQIPSEDIPILNKKINEISINNICLPLYEDIPIINLKFLDHSNYFQELYLPLLNINDNNDFITEFNHNDHQYILSGTIETKTIIYSATIESDNYSYPINIKIINNNDIIIDGILIGKIINPIINNNDHTISGIFQGTFNTNNLSIRSNITENVIINLNIPTKIINYNLTNLKLKNKNIPKKIEILDHITIPYGIISLLTHNYSDNRLNLNLEKSLITKLGIYDSSSNSLNVINDIISINKYGNIKYVTENKVNKKFTEYYSIDGCINPYTWNYSFVQTNEQNKVNSHALYLILDGVFDNRPKYGSSTIDHISYDIAISSEPSPVYLTSSFKQFHDFTFNNKLEDSKLIYSAAIPNTLDFIRKDDNYAYINLMPYDQIKLYSDIKNYKWSLYFQDHIYTNLNSNFVLDECFESPFYYAIVLKIPIKYYILNFKNNNNVTDIFYFKLFINGNR